MDSKEFAEFREALIGLRNAVVDLKMVILDTNQKMSKAMNDSHVKSAMTMLDNSFEFRRMLDGTSSPKRHRQDANYF